MNRAAIRFFGFGLVFAVAAASAYAPLAEAHDPPASIPHASLLEPGARSAALAVDAFHAALRQGDASTAASLLTRDALIFESGEAEQSKAEYAAHHLAADVEFSKNVPSVITGRSGHAVGPLAWIATESRTTGTYRGKPLDLMSTESMILQRSNGAWRIVHVHWSSKAVKKP